MLPTIIMANVRTLQEKTEAVFIFAEANRNFHEAERIFNERFPDRPISRAYLRQLVQKFINTGSVQNRKNPGRPSISEDKQIQIVGEMVVHSQQSTSHVAAICDVSATTVKKFLKRNKFHPYKMKILHQLIEDDPDRRIEFCEVMTQTIARNPSYLRNICFSDECTFYLNGFVNRQNVRYWCDENPHVFREGHTQFQQKLNVWIGILGDHIVGPLFIDGNLTGELYLNMLENLIHPLIVEIAENNPNEFDMDITFQQDGAPPHFSRQVRNYLDATYTRRWIGRRGPTEWPPRSPDLTPLDFFCGGILNRKFFKQNPIPFWIYDVK